MLEVKKFYGTWCGPCKALAPTIEKLKQAHTDVRFEDIDVDVDFETAQFGTGNSMNTLLLRLGVKFG